MHVNSCPCCKSRLGPYLDTLGAVPTGVMGSNNVEQSKLVKQVICTTCGMRGPYNTATKSAVEGWNELPREKP